MIRLLQIFFLKRYHCSFSLLQQEDDVFEAEEEEEDDNCVPAPPIKSPCVSWRPATPPRKRRSGDGASNVEQDKENPAGSGVASASVQVSSFPGHFLGHFVNFVFLISGKALRAVFVLARLFHAAAAATPSSPEQQPQGLLLQVAPGVIHADSHIMLYRKEKEKQLLISPIFFLLVLCPVCSIPDLYACA